MDPLIRPNWHIAFIHLPIGLLVVGSVLELFCVFWRRSQLRTAGQFMILIGALLGLPAALSGIRALFDVSAAGLAPDLYWYEILQASPLSDEAWLLLTQHICLMASAVALYLFVSLWYLASSDPGRRKWYPVRWLLLILALSCLTAGGWYGGEAVHTQRITARAMAVLDASHNMVANNQQIELAAASASSSPFASTIPTTQASELNPTTAPSTQPAIELPPSMRHLQDPAWWYRWTLRIAPPLELHILMAGLSYSMCLLGLALAFRNANVVNSTARSVDPKRSELAISRPTVRPPVVPMEAPAKRTLAIAFLSIAIAAIAGWWLLAHRTEQYIPIRLWRMVAAGIEDPDLRRRLAHFLGAGILGLIPIATLVFAWLAPRKRWPLALLTLLLLAVGAAQAYVGILLAYDGPTGPAWQFNQPPAPPPQPLGPIPPAQ